MEQNESSLVWKENERKVILETKVSTVHPSAQARIARRNYAAIILVERKPKDWVIIVPVR